MQSTAQVQTPHPITRRKLFGLIPVPFLAAATPPRFTPGGQPVPVETVSAYARPHTAIVRRWRPGDVPRCRLCGPGRCGAVGDSCLVVVHNACVSLGAAPLYDASDRPKVVDVRLDGAEGGAA